jgi:hypothetical protein
MFSAYGKAGPRNNFLLPKMTTNNEIELVHNIASLYDQSLQVLNDFEGPSIYFHVQAIRAQKSAFLSDRHIEMIYATLASWGLHRMGDSRTTKTKMVEYENFRSSLLNQRKALSLLRGITMDGSSDLDYRHAIEELKPAYFSLAVSISSSTLVAHSKVLAHVLPDLIPPIDRQYTVRFFTQENKQFFNKKGKFKNVNLPSNKEEQFSLFLDYCIRIKRMLDQCDLQLFKLDPETFNTSYPKIMDNIIMAFVKGVSRIPLNGSRS